MAERYDLPKVPSTTKPSYWNHDTGRFALFGGVIGALVGGWVAGLAIFTPAAVATSAGAALGSVSAALSSGAAATGAAAAAGGALAFMAPFIFPVMVLAGAAVAAKYGARIGIAKQERELAEGKTVKDPTYWNKGIVSGWAVGMVVSAVLDVFGATTGLGLIGGIVGSILHKNNLQKDYDQAVRQRNYDMQVARSQTMQQGIAPTQYMNSVTPQEAQALADKQQMNEASHAQTLLDAQQLVQLPQR